MGKLFVVGLGPGGVEQMTKRAYDALKSCDVIAGYNVYVNLIKEDFKEKEFLSNGMRKEVDRCKLALDEALKGKTVAMISSGDAGVYGMAGIMCQVAKDHPDSTFKLVGNTDSDASMPTMKTFPSAVLTMSPSTSPIMGFLAIV